MNRIFIKTALIAAIFSLHSPSAQANFKFAGKGETKECSQGQQCFGINATLTCKNGAKCYNFGTPKPTCDKKSFCKKLPLPSDACEWEGKGASEKSLKCNLQEMGIVEPA